MPSLSQALPGNTMVNIMRHRPSRNTFQWGRQISKKATIISFYPPTESSSSNSRQIRITRIFKTWGVNYIAKDIGGGPYGVPDHSPERIHEPRRQGGQCSRGLSCCRKNCVRTGPGLHREPKRVEAKLLQTLLPTKSKKIRDYG